MEKTFDSISDLGVIRNYLQLLQQNQDSFIFQIQDFALSDLQINFSYITAKQLRRVHLVWQPES